MLLRAAHRIKGSYSARNSIQADGSPCFQDVDTIYHSQDNREFNLLDFSHLESR